MTRIRIDYYNYEHGGRRNADDHGGGGPYDYAGLVREMSRGDGWPAIFVLGEGDRYELNGGEGAYGAAAALSDAAGPQYVPHFCGLPRQWGLFAPVVFTDPRAIQVEAWFYHRLPDFAARNRNVMHFTVPGDGRRLRLVAVHGDPSDPDMRVADAKQLNRFANPETPTLVAGDWNSVPSGPQWEPDDLDNPSLYPPQGLATRMLWRDGRDWLGPKRPDTRALDYLCGVWDPERGRRVGGIGYHDVAELAGDCTGTFIGGPSGRHRPAYDRMLVNAAWKDRIAPGSYRVYQPVDPDRPDSDHLRISVTVEV